MHSYAWVCNRKLLKPAFVKGNAQPEILKTFYCEDFNEKHQTT